MSSTNPSRIDAFARRFVGRLLSEIVGGTLETGRRIGHRRVR